MSMYNDYVIDILVKQQRSELLDCAAGDRLARQLPGRSASWWRRLIDGRLRPWSRRRGGASTRPAGEAAPVPLQSGPQPAN